MSNFNYGKHTMSMVTTSSAGGQAAAISLPIEGMTCASCVGRVEAALAKVEGVASVSVNLATERADIRLNRAVDRMALIQAIEKVGYDVPQGTIELAIGGMTCASCVRRVEKSLAKLPGVETVAVNLATENATVRYNPALVGRDEFRQAVARAGYGLRAEEQAEKLAIKLLFPMVIFIFPCMFIVILGPAGIRIRETFMSG